MHTEQRLYLNGRFLTRWTTGVERVAPYAIYLLLANFPRVRHSAFTRIFIKTGYVWFIPLCIIESLMWIPVVKR